MVCNCLGFVLFGFLYKYFMYVWYLNVNKVLFPQSSPHSSSSAEPLSSTLTPGTHQIQPGNIFTMLVARPHPKPARTESLKERPGMLVLFGVVVVVLKLSGGCDSFPRGRPIPLGCGSQAWPCTGICWGSFPSNSIILSPPPVILT